MANKYEMNSKWQGQTAWIFVYCWRLQLVIFCIVNHAQQIVPTVAENVQIEIIYYANRVW